MSDSLCVPKLCGADIELGNFIAAPLKYGDSVREASQALLHEIVEAERGVPARRPNATTRDDDPQDRGRHFLPGNGGSAYIDLDHIELCLPEVLSAYDHVAAWHAMLRIARRAQRSANAKRGPDDQIKVLVNNSDGLGHSYGSHLNFLVSRAAFDNILHRRPHYLAFLAAFQASSLPYTGQGKVGSENGAPWVPYQLSQRADFFETVIGLQTTTFRPLVNSRQEALCGPYHAGHESLARLHVIFFDRTLCEVSSLLCVGTMQIVLAMIEAGIVDASLALEDPVASVVAWSHDPTLNAAARLVSGDTLTALQLQRRFLALAERFVASGEAERVVPRAADILALWIDTLDKLEARDWDALTPRLDWVLKQSLLQRAIDQHPSLDWNSLEIKHLDQIYSSLDPSEGLYWSMANAGLVERVVSRARITHLETEPPRDTRAWARAMLLRRAAPVVEEVDWDLVRLRATDHLGAGESWRIDLADPLGTRAARLVEAWPDDWDFDDLARALDGTRLRAPTTSASWYSSGNWPTSRTASPP